MDSAEICHLQAKLNLKDNDLLLARGELEKYKEVILNHLCDQGRYVAACSFLRKSFGMSLEDARKEVKFFKDNR